MTFLGSRTATVNYDVANGNVLLINFQGGAGAGTGSLAGSAVPEPSGLDDGMTLGLLLFSFSAGAKRQTACLLGISVAESPSVAKPHGRQSQASEVSTLFTRVGLKFCALLAFAIAQSPLVSLAAGRQLPLAANRSVTQRANYLSDAQLASKLATDFDSLAFNTTATGQYLPLVRIDNTPASSQLQTSFGLPAYVGETRTFGEIAHVCGDRRDLHLGHFWVNRRRAVTLRRLQQ